MNHIISYAAGRGVHLARGAARIFPCGAAFLLAAIPLASVCADTFSSTGFLPTPSATYQNLTITGQTILARDTGGVCIGCSLPAGLLDLRATNPGASPILRLEATGLGAFDWAVTSPGGTKQLELRDYDPLSGTSSTRFAMDAFGNVGIGIAPPGSPVGARLSVATPSGSGSKEGHPITMRASPALQWGAYPPNPLADGWMMGIDGNTNDLFLRSVVLGGPTYGMLFSWAPGLYLGPDPQGKGPTVSNTLEVDVGGSRATGKNDWSNCSSRESKQDIRALSATEAADTLNGLQPVTFLFKGGNGSRTPGFIAEDVPDLVASAGRTGLNPMNIIGVLTKVMQEQDKKIEELKRKLAEIEK